MEKSIIIDFINGFSRKRINPPHTRERISPQPIEIYCPYTAGSSMDLTARLIETIASKYLGQPMVVVNKAGAGGSVAAAEVIRSKPDGYKLAILPTFSLQQLLKPKRYHLTQMTSSQ